MYRLAAPLLALALLPAAAVAQARPDLAGDWVPDTAKNAATLAALSAEAREAAAARAGQTGPMTIAMTPTRMTVTRALADGTPANTAYSLEGKPSRNQIPGRGEVESTARVDGNAVVITSQNGDVTQRWYLDGKWLVYERSTQYFTSKTYYTRRPVSR